MYAMLNATTVWDFMMENLTLTIILGVLIVLIIALIITMIALSVKYKKQKRTETAEEEIIENTPAEEAAQPAQEVATEAVAETDKRIAAYLSEHGGSVDYVHGEEALAVLTAEHDGYVGVLLPKMDKSELFPRVLQYGSLPRKTFSMGESAEKRYYLEAKEIR